MKISTIAFLAVAFQLVPVTLYACDCGCTCQPLFRFKDGIAPNGPVTGNPASASSEYYTTGYGFHDYGPARAIVTPPPPVDTKEMKPSS
jgi:hypothetical protein